MESGWRVSGRPLESQSRTRGGTLRALVATCAVALPPAALLLLRFLAHEAHPPPLRHPVIVNIFFFVRARRATALAHPTQGALCLGDPCDNGLLAVRPRLKMSAPRWDVFLGQGIFLCRLRLFWSLAAASV